VGILVTGGAGYIGSVLTEELMKEGHSVIVIDNLSRGHREAVAAGAHLIPVDLGDAPALNNIFRRNKIEAVMHLAAYTSVEQSMKEPGKYFQNNVVCGVNLLEAMLRHNIGRIVFSSTAAVYGEPEKVPISEDSPLKPVNVYGDSKLTFERVLHWYAKAYGLEYIALRYFNVAGASSRFGADHHPETNLIPIVVRAALGEIECLPVFGTDYDTGDGTCIRDYIHVLDIAGAHMAALEGFNKGKGNSAYNLGNGEGFSVMEVIETARKVTGADIPVKICPRRPGDPARLIADYNRAKDHLGWQPQHSALEDIIKSAWLWQKKHPGGYDAGR